MWRCLNDSFGYCAKEPEVIESTEVKSGSISTTLRKCGLSPKACGFYQVLSKQYKPKQLKKIGMGIRYVTTYKKKPEQKEPEVAVVAQERLL